MSPRRAFWATWVALLLMGSAWVIGNPLMASPDEPAHAVKAAAVVRGQLLGEPGEGGTRVELPYYWQYTTSFPICYMFQPDVTAECGFPATEEYDTPSVAATPAGKYNPLYYAIVGLPSLAPPGDAVVYGMRAVSLVLGTAFLALGVAALAELPLGRRRWPVVGAAVAVTPMAVYLCASINPAGVEVAAAFALWCRLLVMLRHPDPARDVSRMWTVALATLFLVNARGLSLLWTAMIVVAVVAASSWAEVRRLLANRRTWPAWAAIVVACLAAAGWLLATDTMSVTGGSASGPPFLDAALISVLGSNAYLTNMIGLFGWLDTPLETWVYMLWAAPFGLLTLLGVAVGRRREAATLIGIAVAAFAVPVLVHASQAATLGIIWQGRYVLPFAVGLPVTAAMVLADRLELPDRAVTKAASVSLLAIGVVHGAALLENLHRYVNGESGSWTRVDPGFWSPPLRLSVVLALIAAGCAAWLLSQWAIVRGDRLPAGPPRATDATGPERSTGRVLAE